MTNYEIIQNQTDIPDNYKYYWGYQYRLGEDIIVPYLQKYGVFQHGMQAVEIGSAEGGVLAALVNAGATNALATDIATHRLALGDKITKKLNLNIEFREHNILSEEVPLNWQKKADLVILRDVIEHLDDTFEALDNISKFIKPGGYLYVTFPPYHSPFGGHQHIVMNTLGKLPFIHLLPDFLFHPMIASGRPGDIGEVKRLQKIRLTPGKFVKAAIKAGYSVHKEDYYAIRPVFKMKFGLPTVKITPLSFLPLVKQVISLEASYILQFNK